jgi:hypothetical protein
LRLETRKAGSIWRRRASIFCACSFRPAIALAAADARSARRKWAALHAAIRKPLIFPSSSPRSEARRKRTLSYSTCAYRYPRSARGGFDRSHARAAQRGARHCRAIRPRPTIHATIATGHDPGSGCRWRCELVRRRDRSGDRRLARHRNRLVQIRQRARSDFQGNLAQPSDDAPCVRPSCLICRSLEPATLTGLVRPVRPVRSRT